MRSLKALCNSSAIPEGQKQYFQSGVDLLLGAGGTGNEGALFILNRLWGHYDSGGHSRGRSLRSLILEKVSDVLTLQKKRPDETELVKAKTLLSVLVAMHYDYRYINTHGWFDYELKGIWDLPLRDRIHVSAAAIALSIDELPLLTDWSKERILALIRECRDG